MTIKPWRTIRRPDVTHTVRRPRRLSATERALERAEDRALLRAARRVLQQTGPDDWIPWERVRADLER